MKRECSFGESQACARNEHSHEPTRGKTLTLSHRVFSAQNASPVENELEVHFINDRLRGP